ncbi:MAG: hypothetical protein WBA89_01890 [Microcoleus sp.]|uniref:5-methylcytosine restriction system specificity protein McrC n=1 Tax=Microcoleus sp. TaxID=44472 RepID=UPI003C72E9FA
MNIAPLGNFDTILTFPGTVVSGFASVTTGRGRGIDEGKDAKGDRISDIWCRKWRSATISSEQQLSNLKDTEKIEKFFYIRGRIDVRKNVQNPWNFKLKCHYNEQTGDIEENQIMARTLFIISRSGLCRESVSSTVRKAFHVLQEFVTLTSFKPEACIDRTYHRLNQDCQILQAICRFFLENTGQSHEKGDREMLPLCFAFLLRSPPNANEMIPKTVLMYNILINKLYNSNRRKSKFPKSALIRAAIFRQTWQL